MGIDTKQRHRYYKDTLMCCIPNELEMRIVLEEAKILKRKKTGLKMNQSKNLFVSHY